MKNKTLIQNSDCKSSRKVKCEIKHDETRSLLIYTLT